MCYSTTMDKLVCSVVGCDATPKRLVRGLCIRHYERKRKTGDVGVPTTISNSWGKCVVENCKDKAGPTGACRNHWHKVNNPLKSRKSMLKKKGLTIETYNKLLEQQNGVCKACGSSDAGYQRVNFAVDHDHSCCPSTEVTCGNCYRGILCTRCNLVLGAVNDDVTVLNSLVKYLTDVQR